jgi:translation initiation factor 1
MSKSDARTVWSSEEGDVRKKQTTSPTVKSLPPHEQTAYLHRDSKGRRGGPMTLVKKLALSESDMKELTRKLKQICGSGGTVKDGVIEIQGEHRDKIAQTLIEMGYKVKIAGG